MENLNLCTVSANAFAYLLDRCCGIADRDWGDPRLYCDGFILQELANRLGCRFVVMRCSRNGRLDKVEPVASQVCDDETLKFVFKVARYDESPTHFNVIRNSVEACPRRDRVRERILTEVRHLRGHAYWRVDSFDVTLIAQEILPPSEQKDASSGSSTEQSDTDSDASGARQNETDSGPPLSQRVDVSKTTKTD